MLVVVLVQFLTYLKFEFLISTVLQYLKAKLHTREEEVFGKAAHLRQSKKVS